MIDKITSSKKFPFTKKAIEALSPHELTSPSREAEYSDAECSGLHLLVSKTGRKSMLYRYRYNGKKKSMALGELTRIAPTLHRAGVIHLCS